MASQRLVVTCLIGLGVSLLLVGVVSGTFLRHVVQIVPIVVAVVALSLRPQWGANAAVPLFTFWVSIVVLIWLFLLDVSTLASGDYTPVEKVATVLMAAFSVTGLVTAMRLGKSLSSGWRLAVFASFAVMQVSAMWVSLSAGIVNR